MGYPGKKNPVLFIRYRNLLLLENISFRSVIFAALFSFQFVL